MKDTIVDHEHAIGLSDVARIATCFGPFIIFDHLAAG
jgi:hypothetical protein